MIFFSAEVEGYVFSKCREWEKERRNRLNDAFATLSKVLPCYDPAVNVSKIDILKNAATHIEELQAKLKTLMSESNDDSAKKVKGEFDFFSRKRFIFCSQAKNSENCMIVFDGFSVKMSNCVLYCVKPKFQSHQGVCLLKSLGIRYFGRTGFCQSRQKFCRRRRPEVYFS